MIRIILLLTILSLVGCSSDKKKPKFEAADNSPSSSGDKKEVPDWMKGRKSEDSSQKSVATKDATNDPIKKTGNDLAKGSSDKGTTIPDTNKQGTKGQVTKSKTSDANTKSPITTSKSGEATALMAQLLEKYQASLKFSNEAATKQLSAKESIESREQYAKMIEEWLSIADQLIEMDLRVEDRRAVVALKKLAHETLPEFNRPEHEEKLYAFADTLKEDSDTEIQKLYQFIMLRKPLTKILRKEKVDEDAFLKQFEKFVSFWRDDPAVYRSVEAWLNQMYPVNRDCYAKAIEIAANQFSQSTDKQIMTLSESMSDRLTAIKIGFDLAIADVLTEKPDCAKNLLETAKRLLAQPKLSMNSLIQVVRAGQHIEAIQEYAIAKQYFEELAKQKDKYADTKSKELIEFHVGTAMRRNQLLGQAIKVEGMIPRIESNEFLQKPLDYSAYRGKVVILFFWGVASQMEYQVVDELDRFYEANIDKDIAMIGINVDRRMDIVSRIMQLELTKRNRKWTHLMPMTPKVLGLNSTMAKTCGVDFLPYNVIIDKEGKVDSFRVFGPRLEKTVSRLLGEPVKKVYFDPNQPPAKKDDAKKDDAKKDDAKKAESSQSK